MSLLSFSRARDISPRFSISTTHTAMGHTRYSVTSADGAATLDSYRTPSGARHAVHLLETGCELRPHAVTGSRIAPGRHPAAALPALSPLTAPLQPSARRVNGQPTWDTLQYPR